MINKNKERVMVIRSLILASLFATASAAQAGPVTAPAAANPITWTLTAGTTSVSGTLAEMAAFVASGNWAATSQAWTLFSNESGKTTSVAEMFAPQSALMMVGFNTFKPGMAVASSFGSGAAQVGVSGGGSTNSSGGNGGGSGSGSATGAATGLGAGAGGAGGITTGGDTSGDTTPSNMGKPGVDMSAIVGLEVEGGGGAAEVPEPGSIALLLAGLAGAAMFSRRRSL